MHIHANGCDIDNDVHAYMIPLLSCAHRHSYRCVCVCVLLLPTPPPYGCPRYHCHHVCCVVTITTAVMCVRRHCHLRYHHHVRAHRRCHCCHYACVIVTVPAVSVCVRRCSYTTMCTCVALFRSASASLSPPLDCHGHCHHQAYVVISAAM